MFGVLGLIKRDPTFNTALSIRDYQQRYQVPTINVHNGKLHSLVPMLYHLRYDPNKVVQGLMRELWLKLFGTEFQALINTFQVEIIKYLLANLVSGSWRDREAAIAAFEDFLPRRSWDVIQPFLIEFLEKGINVLDDVRNSTRLAAVGFSKALSDQIVRSCNPNETAHRTVAATIDTVIPFLMEKGLVASSAEGRGFCLGLLLEIIRTAKKHLKACLSDLISVLLESMSAMEPRTLQYMQFHTARLQISEDELEAMRIKLSQASPMNEALDFCLQSLQSSDIPEVIRKISSHLRRGVGLPTRVAATEAMNLLVERYPNDLGKHASTAFHNILLSLTQSPNMAGSLQKAMYTGLGSLAKVLLCYLFSFHLFVVYLNRFLFEGYAWRCLIR